MFLQAIRTRWWQIWVSLPNSVLRLSSSTSYTLIYGMHHVWRLPVIYPARIWSKCFVVWAQVIPRKLHRPQAFRKRSLNPDTLFWDGRYSSHINTSWIMQPSLGSTGKSLDSFIYLYLLCRHSISDKLKEIMIIKLFFFNIFLSLLSLLTFLYDLARNNKLKEYSERVRPFQLL